jgi:lauroyl/myristoyl acyltransferase
MAASVDPALATALQQARCPVERCRTPPVTDLRTRVATSTRIRRLLPTRLMVRRAQARGRAVWAADPEERDRALRAMEAIVGGTERAHELEPLAREHVVETIVRRTLFWQPWAPPSLEQASLERLSEALHAGRGVVLSPCHCGPYLLGVSAIAPLGRTTYSASSWALLPPAPGYWGRRIARRRQEARARDERLVHSAGSFALLRALLQEREVVSVFFAMPGSRRTQFLGKTVMLASGSARLATETDALVLPLRTRRAGHRVWVDVAEPLDPRELGGLEELHEALAAVHERWILELPASMEDPNREGAWERSATAEGWLRPEHAAAPDERSAGAPASVGVEQA